MREIELRGLKKGYLNTNGDDTNYGVFYNKLMNNTILFSPLDESCDIVSICNGIANEPYEYLINMLNTESNIAVVWSQIEGTTSDYRIIHNFIPTDRELMDWFNVHHAMMRSIKRPLPQYKYTEVIAGLEIRVDV